MSDRALVSNATLDGTARGRSEHRTTTDTGQKERLNPGRWEGAILRHHLLSFCI